MTYEPPPQPTTKVLYLLVAIPGVLDTPDEVQRKIAYVQKELRLTSFNPYITVIEQPSPVEEQPKLPVHAHRGDTVHHEGLGDLEFIGWHEDHMVCWQAYPMNPQVRGEIRRITRQEWDKITIDGHPVIFEERAKR